MNAGGMTITCLRFATACGMSDRLRLDLVLNDFVACAMATGEITVLSDGTPWRPLIDVGDMARAIEWAIGRDPAAGGEMLSVNVGSDAWNYQVRDLAEAVAAAMPGTDVWINREAPPDKRSYQVDFSLFRKLAPEHQPLSTLGVSIGRLKTVCEYGFCRPRFPQFRADPSEGARTPDREGRAAAVPRWRHGTAGARGMKFLPTPLAGAYTIELEKRGDDRGFFARLFCENEFAEAGLVTRFRQVNNSLTAAAGTLRGMHYQLPPAAEVKVVRCIRGALYDVIVDLRPDSPTYLEWFGAELSAENRAMMYVPRGFAHGFITLTDDTEALYFVSAFYAPEQERGVRFDDPRFGIRWPIAPKEMSGKDREWPDYDPAGPIAEALWGCR